MIDLVGLTAKRDTRVLKLSGGQQRRLDVAIALTGNPDLLFLDEPTTGFYPSARHEAWEVIKNLAALGKTVLLTTHYMDEAQYLADQVAVISGGRIVAEGPPGTIGNRDQARARIRYRLAGRATPPADLTALPGPDGLIELVPDDLTAALHRLTGWALEQHVELNGLEVIRPSLEDVYLELTDSPVAQAGAEPATTALAGGKGRGDYRRFRPAAVQRQHPGRPHAAAVPGHAAGRGGQLLRARLRGHHGHPERRCGARDRQRVDPAAAVPVRGLHPAGQQRPSVNRVDRPDLPGLALRPGHAGRLPRHRVQLDRRGNRRRLGPGGPAGLGPLLQLGTA